MGSSGVITAIRGSILLLALLVFLGNIMMWIIMPTDTYYNDWLLHILAATSSTFFEIQGPIMLDFTFPILFIAVLGCLYLHLGKKTEIVTTNRISKCDKKLRFMRRPMIVKGLGIVTMTELALLTMFVALCVWYYADYVRHWFKQVLPRSIMKREKVWQTKLDRVAIVTGVTGNLCLTFLFYPVTRGSSILPMLGLTSEASIKYHIWLGNMAMALITAHGFLYIIYWIITNRLSEMLQWGDHYVSNLAGEISLLCGLALWITTYPSIRRNRFELFYFTHQLYALFIIFFVLHIGIGFSCIMLPGFYLFLIDRYLRFLQSTEKVRLVFARVLPFDTLELNFSKSPSLKYSPTSSIFINVPTISKLQWHPFTITSNCNLEAERLSVVVKCEGRWTRELYDLILSPQTMDRRLQVSVEGPYGPASTNFLRHEMLVMISGGSGITPFISIIKELIYIKSTLKGQTPKILLISVFKNSSSLSILDLILPISNHMLLELDIQIEAYVTREKGRPKDDISSATQTVFFKPGPSDRAVSPVLGPNSWLWLAAIISSSFIIFLVLLGIFTQYVVYPVDQNTNMLYSYTKKGSMNILFVCFSILTATSGAFLWNKKENAKEAKQIQDSEDSLTSRSTNSSSENEEYIEMESLPLWSAFESVNVHYGQRPDLKRLLLGIDESSVGALVSGPKQMRQDVAAICSSGQAGNLHYESISFTW